MKKPKASAQGSTEVKVKSELILDNEQFEKWTDFLVWLKKDKQIKKTSKAVCGNIKKDCYLVQKLGLCPADCKDNI